jgi:predicted ATP-binding protein involved in virulence
MRIDSLTVQNFNGFRDRTFSFNPHFNLIIGDNAAGKTSLVDALAVAVGSWFLGIPGYEESPGIHGRAVRLAAHAHLDSYTFEKQFPSRIECTGAVMGRPINWSRELRREGGRTTTGGAAAIRDLAGGATARVRNGEPITLPLISSYGVERLSFVTIGRRGDAPNGRPSRLDGYRDCLQDLIQETALIDWIRDESTVTAHLEKDTIALRVVREAIIGCVESAKSIYYDGRYKDLVVELEGRGLQLCSNLSHGQIMMLTLIGDLAKRAAILNPHLGSAALRDTPGVVMIDELDLHLHPRWQRRVIHDLKTTFPSLQFIATTHSPQLIGEALPEEIRLLDGDETTNPPRSFGIDSSRILEEVMGARSRDAAVEELLKRLSQSIDREQFDDARGLLGEVEAKLGPDDPEVMRARTLMTFLESEV